MRCSDFYLILANFSCLGGFASFYAKIWFFEGLSDSFAHHQSHLYLMGYAQVIENTFFLTDFFFGREEGLRRSQDARFETFNRLYSNALHFIHQAEIAMLCYCLSSISISI